MSHFPRLLKVLRVAGGYRLDEYLNGQPGVAWIKALLLPFRLTVLPGRHRHKRKHQRLREAMEELGPVYIKFGQLLSTRRDFLDTELADELQALQDRVPPFTSPGIESILEQAFGTATTEIFRELDSAPFASASVAQVHRAILNNGDEVVVKVIRPGIDRIIRQDIRLLKWLARRLEARGRSARRLRPLAIVNDYEKVILNELNLLAEASSTTQLRRNFEGSAVLYVPRVYWDHTRRNVLVMERIRGIPVTDIEALKSNGVDLKQLAETGVNIFFTQVFEHNFFHADMHPGNIFVAPEQPEAPRYIAIDCAIIGSLSDDDQEYLAKNLLALFKRDYRRVAELHVASGWVPRGTPVQDFETAMRSVCEPVFARPLGEISFGQLLVQLFRTAGRFDMEVQPSLVLLQKTLLQIEGLGRQLYPQLDLWQTALPWLELRNSQRLNPFSLIARFQQQAPDWIEQLPHLPGMLIDAAAQSSRFAEINESLRRQHRILQRQAERRRRRARNGAIGALLLAVGSALPPVNQALAGLPLASLGLGLAGLYLLYLSR